MSGSRVRVMVVDDHPIVRQGIVSLVAADLGLSVVGEASSVTEAVERCRSLRPDVVLLDLRLGAESGVAVVQAVHAAIPEVRFVVFTTYDDDEDVYRALRAGAVGYLLKDAFCDEIVDVVRRVAAGERCVPQALEERLAERDKPLALSARECDVLELVAHGLSNREIGDALSISEGTVKTHVVRILAKLEVADRTEAATLALRRGLIRL